MFWICSKLTYWVTPANITLVAWLLALIIFNIFNTLTDFRPVFFPYPLQTMLLFLRGTEWPLSFCIWEVRNGRTSPKWVNLIFCGWFWKSICLLAWISTDRQVSKRLNHLECLICVEGRGKGACKSHQLKKEKTYFF